MSLFFERPDFGERAVLVHLKLNSESEPEDPREFEELVLSAGGDPVEFLTGSRTAPHAKFFVGSGKLNQGGGSSPQSATATALAFLFRYGATSMTLTPP